jgi:spore coat polysaccharide biosynthesis protein SpsF
MKDKIDVSIIQARMGSSRLPGKVLMKIGAKPILQWAAERVKKSLLVDKVIVATSDNKRDDAIEELCKRLGMDCFRGSEDDVLERYYRASKRYKANSIVRITSDCPLVDPEIIDEIIRIHLKHKNDCTMNDTENSYPRGLDVEIFNFKALEKAYLNAKKNYQREHVSPYIYEHPEVFKIERVEANGIFRRPAYRFCVDTKDDLELTRKIYAILNNSKKPVNARNIIKLLDSHPELAAFNSHIKQKILGE